MERTLLDVDPSWLYLWRHDTDLSKAYLNVLHFLKDCEEKKVPITPKLKNVLRAFSYFPWWNTKVVIVGQDPYPGIGDADGLCFSSEAYSTPKSLQSIRNVLKTLYGRDLTSNSLEYWAKQGVLLLNTALTTIEGAKTAHMDVWQEFTSGIIRFLNAETECCFIAWGTPAQKAASIVPAYRKETYYHPVVDCYGQYSFSGCKSFTEIDKKLAKTALGPINWV